MMTQMYEVRKLLPPLNYVTALDIYMFSCMIHVSLSLVEYAFAYTFMFEELNLKSKLKKLMKKKDKTEPKDENYLATLRGFRTWTSRRRFQANGVKAITDYFPTEKRYKSWLDKISKYAFTLSFLTFNLSYFGYYYATGSGFSDAQSLEW